MFYKIPEKECYRIKFKKLRMKSIILIFLISLNVFSQNRGDNIQSVKQIKADKTRKELNYINQIHELMTKSYERGLFNGNVLVAKREKSSIKNHLALPMKRE